MISQPLIPAIRNMKEFERLLRSDYEYLTLLHTHLSHVQSIVKLAHQNGKKIVLHMDMIDGLKSDEQATEYICQTVRPDGIISTKKQVILTAKKKGMLTIQRLFLIDRLALEHGLELIEKTNPDYIELLPGVAPSVIGEVKERTNIPLIAGGLIQEPHQVKEAIGAGAISVSTSAKALW